MKTFGSAWAEIDKNVLKENAVKIVEYVKSHNSRTKVLAVVKADGYGHGAIISSQLFIEAGVDYLGVATLYEAIELRQAGIKAPILVFGYTPDNLLKLAFDFNITLTINTIEAAKFLDRLGRQYNRKATVHIKVNIGMNRLGFKNDSSLLRNMQILKGLYLELEGFYAHFPLADATSLEETHNQARTFNTLIKNLEKPLAVPFLGESFEGLLEIFKSLAPL